MGDPVALLLGLEDVARRGRRRRASVSIISLEQLAPRAGCSGPASVKRSKKVRSLGQRARSGPRGANLAERRSGPRDRSAGGCGEPPRRARAWRSQQLRLDAARLVAVRRSSRDQTPSAPSSQALVLSAKPRSSTSSSSAAIGLVLDRRDQLDPVVEVARHQVGGADEDAGLLAALEGVDPRVLEEAADDRDDPDVLRDPGHARAQAADAAHVEVDLRPRPARPR